MIADSVAVSVEVGIGTGIISAIILGILGYAIKNAIDDRTTALADAAAKAVLAAQEHQKAVEAVAVDVRDVRDKVTMNGGTEKTLGDAAVRIERTVGELTSRVTEHIAEDALQFSAIRNKLEIE